MCCPNKIIAKWGASVHELPIETCVTCKHIQWWESKGWEGQWHHKQQHNAGNDHTLEPKKTDFELTWELKPSNFDGRHSRHAAL